MNFPSKKIANTKFNGVLVRTIKLSNKTYFVGNDIARALKYKHISKILN